jgi:guanine deaminase
VSATELLRATLFHTPGNPFHDVTALHAHADGGLLVRDGRIVAVGDYEAVRKTAPDVATTDWRGGFLLPGFVDTHVHFPQLRIVGSLGRSLLDWLDAVALPEEARMADLQYAQRTAGAFVRALTAHGTTTALVFGAHFAPATAALFDEAAAHGLRLTSGLILSDRALRPELHQRPADAHRDATELIRRYHQRGRLLYAVTPRFALSTSEAMLEVCQTLRREHDDLRVQTHLNENVDEIAAVRQSFPWATDYFGVYQRYGLTGPNAVMAHDVWPTDAELERLASSRTTVAHCPGSNAALGSGIFPLRRHLAAGVHCALGTDVGGGIGLGLLQEALQAYLMQRLAPDGVTLDAARLLYLATRAGADALGLVHEIGDFAPGKAADFVYFEARPESLLAAALERADDLAQVLSTLVTLAGQESVREVRIEGTPVYRAERPARSVPSFSA